MLGEAENVPPSMLYCTVNPVTALTVGKAKADAQVLADAVMVGADGKTAIQTVLVEVIVVFPDVLITLIKYTPAGWFIVPCMVPASLALSLVLKLTLPIGVGEPNDPKLFDNWAVKVLLPVKPVSVNAIFNAVCVFAQKTEGFVLLIVIVCATTAFAKDVQIIVNIIIMNFDLVNIASIKE